MWRTYSVQHCARYYKGRGSKNPPSIKITNAFGFVVCLFVCFCFFICLLQKQMSQLLSGLIRKNLSWRWEERWNLSNNILWWFCWTWLVFRNSYCQDRSSKASWLSSVPGNITKCHLSSDALGTRVYPRGEQSMACGTNLALDPAFLCLSN